MRNRSQRRGAVRAIGIFVIVVLSTTLPFDARLSIAAPPEATSQSLTVGPARRSRPHTSSARRAFARRSPWNRPIPDRPKVARRSRSISRYLGAGPRGSVVANLYSYGVPIFRATRHTPRVRVRCTRPWGRCGLERRRVPVPRRARPSPGSDRAMVVRTAKRSYEFWRARKAKRGWRADWGGVARMGGWGRSRRGRLPTGAGLSRLAGVVTVREMKRRKVRHALVFSTNNSFRWRD